jgi:type II secretion system protein J
MRISHNRTVDRVKSVRLSALLTRRGFTLVEILIAMGILSLVLAAIYSSWTAILRASKTGLEAAAAVQRARMAARTIEESLGSAESFAAHVQVHPEYYAFVADNGDKAMLSFVTRLGPSFPRSGKFGDLDLRRVAFAVESSPEGKQLVLRQCPLLMEMDKDEQALPLVLAKYVKEFKTEFWDIRLADWVDEWKTTNQLPVMVKVTLKLGANAYSSQVREQITRFVSLPSVAVMPMWQVSRGGPGMPGGPGGPGGLGNPGGLPPGSTGVPPKGAPGGGPPAQ